MAWNICFVSPTYYGNTVGGVEVQLYFMAKGLAKLDAFNVAYLTTDIDESRTIDGVRFIRIPGDTSNKSCSFEQFESALDDESPDLVFQQGRKQFTHYSARYCKSRKIPFVFGAASDIDCRYLRQVPRFFVEFPLKRLRNPMDISRALVMDLRTYSAMRSAQIHIAQTETQRNLLERVFGKKSFVYGNPHEIPAEDELVKDDPPLVLWLASVKSSKRPELFIDIARRLKGRGYRMMLAGRMNAESYRKEIEAAASDGTINYVENVAFEDSNALIAKARVFVLTSIYEGLPNTLIQAWLRRTPTVSCGFDPGGLIEDNDLGAYVTSVEAAVDAIVKLMEDEDEYARVAAGAREFAIASFGMDVQAEKLGKIMLEALPARAAN